MTLQEAGFFLLNQLRTVYDEGEASAIGDCVMESLTGSDKTERMIYKNNPITAEEEKQLRGYAAKLLQHTPVQYVLNESWFCGLKFYVDENVLIPRPETEELVEWVISNCRFPIDTLSILDIGTGSGCIPISLKRRLRKARVTALDISEGALTVAKRNAAKLGAELEFIQLDILDPAKWAELNAADIIISNPPYIPENNKASMHPNVLAFEPHIALFVPDQDALLFYKAIIALAKTKLTAEGLLFFEIHEDLGREVTELLSSEGFASEIKKDMQGKDRMVMGRRDVDRLTS
ncbi:MAG TPA: peptide chain release factor N(5)-glutamine methyltransferase [Chitinophagaceae bacterium]|nr:peptide chain release factor N(5)-glutamine methyltransferase [Chitinophagaceae bacterium]